MFADNLSLRVPFESEEIVRAEQSMHTYVNSVSPSRIRVQYKRSLL